MIRVLLALSKISGIVDAFIKKNVSVFRNTIGIFSGGQNFHHTSSRMTCELAEKVLKEDGLLNSEV